MKPLPYRVCTRCNIGTEYYTFVINRLFKEREVVLCSDCCIEFINYELSIRPFTETETSFIDFATNTHP